MPTKTKKTVTVPVPAPKKTAAARKKATAAKAPSAKATVAKAPLKKAVAQAAATGTGEPVRSIRDDLPVLTFKTSQAFDKWMHEHHEQGKGLWLRLYKKESKQQTITRAEAIDVVLCFGWIDGVANKYDEVSFLQRFTPRRSKSIWSKVNIGHVARLTEAGRMRPRGLKEVEAAKADGRWEQAYDPPSQSTIPDDFLSLVKKNKAAYAFFQTLNKTNLFAISWRLQTAKKPETKARRTAMIIAMLAEGKKFH